MAASPDIPLCTMKELEEILTDEMGMMKMPTDDYSEIISGLYIGTRRPALNNGLLETLGITHIVNCAQGNRFMHVNTDESHYKDTGIRFLGLRCNDTQATDVSQHFDEVSDFIEEALAGRGKVMVHCVQGFSRSATFVIAYFMSKKGMTAQAAVGFVRAKREIGPNDGFLKQIIELNERLHRERLKENKSQTENKESVGSKEDGNS